MAQLQMIFERRADGSPAPRMPRTGDGIRREPDGVRFFSLEQAVEFFAMKEEELRALYDDAYGDLFNAETAQGESTGVPNIDTERVVEVRRDLLRVVRFPHLSDAEFDAVMEMCQRRRLDPWRHVYADAMGDQRGRRELKVITTIDAFRLLADRTEKYDGTTLAEYLDADGNWHKEVWPTRLGNPVAAKIGVRRKGFSQPQYEVATWDRYVQYIDTPRGPEVSEFWVKGGAQQLAKCALALAYRSAFPEEIGGLYTRDEMAQAHNPASVTPRVAAPPAVVERRAQAIEAEPEEVVFDEETPETLVDFNAALEGFGFVTEDARKAVIAKLRMNVPYSPTSRTFWALAVKRLRTRPDLYGVMASV